MLNKIKNFIKKNKHPLLIIVIFLIFSYSVFSPGFLLTHDGESQLIRVGARIKALLDGEFPVRWAGDLNYGYGTPGLIFYYSLTGYFASFLYFLGFSLEQGFKALSVIVFVLSPITYYFFAKEIFKKEIAFVSSLFYGLAPYSFLDMYVRGHLGESMALVIIPLVLLFMEKNTKKITFYNIVFGAISYAFLVLAHGILSVILSVVFLGYAIFSGKKKLKIIFSNLSILFLGLILSAYKWAPAYLEAKYINSRLFVSDWYKDHFLNINNIFYSKWGFGDFVNKPNGLSAQIGPVHSFFALVAFLLFKKIKNNILVFYWLLVFLAAIFMSTSLSSFVWSRVHLIQQFQFPWRFTAVSMLSASILAGYVLQKLQNKKLMYFVIILLFILAIPMTKAKIIPSKSDAYYFNNPANGSYHNEGTTIWLAGDPYEYPKEKVEIVSGYGRIESYTRHTTEHTFKVVAKTDVEVLDNTVYFPGWRVNVDNNKVPIEFQNPNHRGLITFNVNKGTHNVRVYFGDTPIRYVADLITVIGILFILFCFINSKLNF